METYRWGSYVFSKLENRSDSNDYNGGRIVTLNGRQIFYPTDPVTYNKSISLSATFWQPATRVIDSMSSGLATAYALGVGPNNTIYAADNTTGEIKRLNANGVEIASLTIQASVKDIRGVAHDGSNIWVLRYAISDGRFDLCKLDNSGTILVRYVYDNQFANPSGLAYMSPYLYILTEDGLIQKCDPNTGNIYNVALLSGYDKFAGLTIINAELCAGGVASYGVGFMYASDTDGQILGGTYFNDLSRSNVTGLAYVNGKLFMTTGSSSIDIVRLNTVDIDVYKLERECYGSYVTMKDELGNSQNFVVTGFEKKRRERNHVAYEIQIEARQVYKTNPV